MIYGAESTIYTSFDLPILDIGTLCKGEIIIRGSLDDHFLGNPGSYPWPGDVYSVEVRLNDIVLTTLCPLIHGKPFRPGVSGFYVETITEWIIPIEDLDLLEQSNNISIKLLDPVESIHWIIIDWIALRATFKLDVSIDIKPGSEPNCFNQNNHGVIPVAIFGSTDLDVNDISIESLSLQGLEVKIIGKSNKYLSHFEFVNYDEYTDLIVQFEDDEGWTISGIDYAILSGRLHDGTPIEGKDSICIVP